MFRMITPPGQLSLPQRDLFKKTVDNFSEKNLPGVDSIEMVVLTQSKCYKLRHIEGVSHDDLLTLFHKLYTLL